MSSKPPLRLSNPFVRLRSEDRVKVVASVDPTIARYLFKTILPEQGHAQNVLATFLFKLFEECQRRGIGLVNGAARWDESCESQVAQLMSNLNFTSIDELQSRLLKNESTKPRNRSRTSPPRRSDPPPAEPTT